MTRLRIRCDYVNETKGHMIDSEPWGESWTSDIGLLFRVAKKGFGRCVSKIFIDQGDKPPIQVGWVFQSRQVYEGSRQTYIREIWVNLGWQEDDGVRAVDLPELRKLLSHEDEEPTPQ